MTDQRRGVGDVLRLLRGRFGRVGFVAVRVAYSARLPDWVDLKSLLFAPGAWGGRVVDAAHHRLFIVTVATPCVEKTRALNTTWIPQSCRS